MKSRITRALIFLLGIFLLGCNLPTEITVAATITPTSVPKETVGPAATSPVIVTPTINALPSQIATQERFQQLPFLSLPEFNARYSPRDLALSPDGNYLAVVSKDRQDEDKTIWIWKAHDFTMSLAGYQINADVWSVAFSSDGSQLAVGCAGKIILLEWETGNLITTIEIPNAVAVELSFGPNHTLAFSDFNDSVTVWDLTLNKIRYSVNGIVGFDPNHFAISPDGNWLVTASVSEMLIWDYETGKLIYTRKSPSGGIGFAPAFAFSADGSYLAAGGCSQFRFEGCIRGEMLLWQSDVLTLHLLPFPERIRSLAFSMDNRYMAMASMGDQVQFLDLRNRALRQFPSLEKPIKIPPDDSFSIYDMLFLTDRNELVVSTTDGIQLLDAVTLSRAPNLSFRLRLNYPYQITASGDNLNVRASPSLNGTILQKLHKGDGFNTMDGPIFADHQIWWKVKIADGTEGWIIETPTWYVFDP